MPTTVIVVGHQGATSRHDLAAILTPEQQDSVRSQANRWIKALRLVRYGDVSMRERFTYRGDSLWWFTELYLHKMRRLEQAVQVLAALETLIESHAPARLVVDSDAPSAIAAANAVGLARRIPVEVVHGSRHARRRDSGRTIGIASLLSRLRPSVRRTEPRARVAAFVHTAFWKQGSPDGPGRETYIGEVLSALGTRIPPAEVRMIGLGPSRNFRARRWWDPLTASATPEVTPIERFAPRTALTGSLAIWRQRYRLADEIVAGEAIRDAARIGPYDLWSVLSAELQDAARVQWPWSARAMDEAAAALTALAPDVAMTYAEAGGWGRSLILEARRLSIPTVGLQHGFIYRHWLNYQHEDDEMRPSGADAGFPLPTRTLVFDRYAAATLETEGHFRPDALRVTGSPKLDELADRINQLRDARASIRRSFGVDDDDRLLILAAKASELGARMPALFEAVRAIPGVRLVVKPHPAETRDAYQRHLRPADPIVIDDPHGDLGRLLAAADGLVTRNSTVAIDGLVLGVPALVLGAASNLSPFVDAGVMLGARDETIGEAVRTLLYDRASRDALRTRAEAFAETFDMRAGRQAASRAADEILSIARRG